MTVTAPHDPQHDHGRAHGHDHPHDHDHPAVAEGSQHRGTTYGAAAVLDIGADIGAVVLYTPSALAGLEIDIVGLGPGTTSTHSLVRERVMPEQIGYAATYPGLPAGSYRIAETAGFPATDVEVHGGRVTEVDWS